MGCCGMDMEECHQVAFLTIHGWELVGGEWHKEGFERQVESSHPCGCCTKTETTSEFPLEAAYWAQQEASS